jgi:transposase
LSFARIGLEAGPLSQWLFSGLAEAGLPAICIETRHAKAFLQPERNKTDRNDARGIAQMMRVKLFRPVHVKTLRSQQRRALLPARKLLQEKAIAIENDIRGLLRNFGLKVGAVSIAGFDPEEDSQDGEGKCGLSAWTFIASSQKRWRSKTANSSALAGSA